MAYEAYSERGCVRFSAIRRARSRRIGRCGVELIRRRRHSCRVGLARSRPSSSSSPSTAGVDEDPTQRRLADLDERALARRGASGRSGNCATFWPPLLTTGRPRAGAGVKAKLLGTTKRAGGALQVTYAGHPLYTFKLERAGQTTGEGAKDFGPPFYAVSPSGAAVVK
jgi:hypothetical protein